MMLDVNEMSEDTVSDLKSGFWGATHIFAVEMMMKIIMMIIIIMMMSIFCA